MASLVQYYIMHRPKHPITGEIIRGKAAGATRNADNSINEGATLWYPEPLTSPGPNGTKMSTSAAMTGTMGKVDGEPWILHSVHFSLEEALAAAKPVVMTVGAENVRILKSIAHDVEIKVG